MTLFVAVEHGECEIILCKFISLWLRTDVVPVSKANGSETISLRESGEYLCQGPFKDLKSLNRYYRDYKKGRSTKNLKMDEITIFGSSGFKVETPRREDAPIIQNLIRTCVGFLI